MRVLRAADHRRMPWKNGGGETIEIAAFPEGAGLDDFDWRVSMARVTQEGPFSIFPGVDRILAILDGTGLDLEVEGIGTTSLTQASDPFAFPADAPAAAHLHDGPITDLNVMTRRGRGLATVRKGRAGDTVAFQSTAAILVALGPLRLAGIRLARYDALLWNGSLAPAFLLAQEGAEFFHIAIAEPPA